MTLPSIRFQLFSITSLVILCFVVVLAVLDYRREVQQHILEKQSDLHEEAKTVLPGIVHTREHGPEAVQSFIDSVCSRMDKTHSPNHHIAVKVKEEFYEASTYYSVPPEQLEAMKIALSTKASDGRHVGHNDFLVGIYSDGAVTVVVTESIAALRSAVMGAELLRFAGIILTGMAAAIIVHLLLVRLVSLPLEALAAKVRLVGQGVYDSWRLGLRVAPV